MKKICVISLKNGKLTEKTPFNTFYHGAGGYEIFRLHLRCRPSAAGISPEYSGTP